MREKITKFVNWILEHEYFDLLILAFFISAILNLINVILGLSFIVGVLYGVIMVRIVLKRSRKEK